MRTWRAGRSGLDEADRLAAGGRAGPASPGLDHLLDALRAPATAGDRSAEQSVAAALAAERRRAAQTTRRRGGIRVHVPASTRTIVVSIATALAVLGVAGTAVAAGTGNLPSAVQQRAHRLFSALGVPAPGTGPTSPAPQPAATSNPATPATTASPTATATPTTVPAQQLAWCVAWREAVGGDHPMNGRDRRDLIAAAGGEDQVGRYCAGLTGAVSPTPAATTTAPGKSGSHRATPAHPTPHATTPSHPGGKE
ncbi:hypothetical protein ACIA5D_33745 [Actinoplanes sp. NPDC051513]|uniref:hypothetical protein n=1 Tax=Actinoplanes sp. NPDC051513 TaxID=3363908 RepID=UPI0037A4F42D